MYMGMCLCNMQYNGDCYIIEIQTFFSFLDTQLDYTS